MTDRRLELEPLADLDTAREPWQALGEAGGNVFGTWEWGSSWWRHFGRGRRLALAACRRPDGTAAGVLPLYEARRAPMRLLRFVGHGPADQLGPVCAAEDRPAVGEALTRALAGRRTCWRKFELRVARNSSQVSASRAMRGLSSRRTTVPPSRGTQPSCG